jgi:hypothetical protein
LGALPMILMFFMVICPIMYVILWPCLNIVYKFYEFILKTPRDQSTSTGDLENTIDTGVLRRRNAVCINDTNVTTNVCNKEKLMGGGQCVDVNDGFVNQNRV